MATCLLSRTLPSIFFRNSFSPFSHTGFPGFRFTLPSVCLLCAIQLSDYCGGLVELFLLWFYFILFYSVKLWFGGLRIEKLVDCGFTIVVGLFLQGKLRIISLYDTFRM